MTDEQINEAIETVLHGNEHWLITRDYCADLNAMHEVEKVLTFEDWEYYCEKLGGSFRGCAHATARQRAEALLRVIGKWRRCRGD